MLKAQNAPRFASCLVLVKCSTAYNSLASVYITDNNRPSLRRQKASFSPATLPIIVLRLSVGLCLDSVNHQPFRLSASKRSVCLGPKTPFPRRPESLHHLRIRNDRAREIMLGLQLDLLRDDSMCRMRQNKGRTRRIQSARDQSRAHKKRECANANQTP